MKAAIVVLSDPKSGTEDALGRLFNALASAYDFKHSGDDVTILFQGQELGGLEKLAKLTTLPTLFQEVVDKVAGVSCVCWMCRCN